MISLIHPSRGRPIQSFNNSKEWCERAGVKVELLVSVDSDDPMANEYKRRYDCSAHINDNKSLVEATNRIAQYAVGDILLYLSDDFKCFDNWGVEVEKEFFKYTGPTLLKFDDCLQRFNVAVLTIPAMNMECYKRLGYFFHPDFRSMHCDEHLYWKARQIGALKFAEHIKFEHLHACVGKAANDDTYKRSALNWDHGVQTLKKHRKLGFP